MSPRCDAGKRGELNITFDSAECLADALGVSLVELLSG